MCFLTRPSKLSGRVYVGHRNQTSIFLGDPKTAFNCAELPWGVSTCCFYKRSQNGRAPTPGPEGMFLCCMKAQR